MERRLLTRLISVEAVVWLVDAILPIWYYLEDQSLSRSSTATS